MFIKYKVYEVSYVHGFKWNTSVLINSTVYSQAHTHTCLMALCPVLPGWAGTRKVKPIWILLKQDTVSGSGISWAICKSAPCSRQITTPAPHHSDFYRPDALPATQPTASKHWAYSQAKVNYSKGTVETCCLNFCFVLHITAAEVLDAAFCCNLVFVKLPSVL